MAEPPHRPEIESRLQNDVGGLQTVITDTASSLLSNAVILISTLIAMTVLSWQLTLLSVSGVLLAKVFGRQDRDAQRHDAQSSELARLQVDQQIVGRASFAVVSTFFSVTPVLVYLVAGFQLRGHPEACSVGAHRPGR